MRTSVASILPLLLALTALQSRAADDDLKAQMEALRKEVDALRKERVDNQGLKRQVEALQKKDAASKPVGTGVVDKVVDNKYGPSLPVTTKQGKLQIGGLLQVWYYNIENDNLGFFGDRTPTALAGGDTNEGRDNDSFAIRRAQVSFTMDIHENVRSFIQFDVARPFGGRMNIPNTGVALRYATASASDTTGDSFKNILQDAYVNFHGMIPHHDAQIGQFLPQVGLEGPQSASTLDFCERAMITQLSHAREVGAQLHGTWMDDRIQYWLGTFNSPGNWLDSGTANDNRADNNDEKSFLVSALFRPVWKNETWGNLQIGGSAQFNKTGESGYGTDGYLGGTPGATTNTALCRTDNIRYYGLVTYAPGGPVKGWWLKGEYAWIRGRADSGTFSAGGVMGTAIGQTDPRAFDTQGWYVSTGYKLSDSIWADDLPAWLKPAEFCFRYDTYGNIQVADRAMPNERHDVWKTSIYTAGLNYYIKGHNAKIQVNYNWVREPDEDHDGGPAPRRLRDVENDNLVVNFQVAW